jgi:ferrous-iron efflux pump FieF
VVSADEFHYRSDLILNGSVILSLLATTQLGWPYIDPIFGAGIGLWIIYGAWQVANKAIVQLMDRELPDEARARIRQILRELPALPKYLIELGYETDTSWVRDYRDP